MQNSGSRCPAQDGELANMSASFLSSPPPSLHTDPYIGPNQSACLIWPFTLMQTPPTPEEMGHCDSVHLSEVGDTQVVVFKHGES